MGRTKNTDSSDQFIRKNFGKVWPAFVRRYTEYTLDCRKNFDGDLELMLVLAVIGDSTLNAKTTRPDLTHLELMEDPLRHVLPEYINASSIAEYSGIPRETVRRKIAVLLEKGWITKSKEGTFVASEKASRDLAPMMEIGIRYIRSMFSLFEQAQIDENKCKKG